MSRARIRVIPLILWLLFGGVIAGIVVVNLQHDAEERLNSAGVAALAHMSLDPEVGHRASRRLATMQWMTPPADIDPARPIFVDALRSDDLEMRRRALVAVGDLAESYVFLHEFPGSERARHRPFAFADLLPYLTPAVTMGSIESRIEATYVLVDIGHATRLSGHDSTLISVTLRCLGSDPNRQLAAEATRALALLEAPPTSTKTRYRRP